jgi:hypothetical protein
MTRHAPSKNNWGRLWTQSFRIFDSVGCHVSASRRDCFLLTHRANCKTSQPPLNSWTLLELGELLIILVTLDAVLGDILVGPSRIRFRKLLVTVLVFVPVFPDNGWP